MTNLALRFLFVFFIAVLAFKPLWAQSPNQSADITVTTVNDTGLVAKFYLPKTSGKHPAVIVIGGSEGGIKGTDRWGEPLAERGYAVLPLAYFGAEKLPPQLEEIPLEYFKKAIDWLRANPAVDRKRIALVGASRGGEAALLIASTYPQIKAVVAGVPSHVVWQSLNFKEQTVKSSWMLGGKPVPFVPYNYDAPFTTMLDMFLRSLQQKAAVEAAIIPVEKIKGPILIISGKDDQLWASSLMCDFVVERLRNKRFRFTYEHLSYENAGHAILRPTSTNPSSNSAPTATVTTPAGVLQMGGTKEGNAAALTDIWTKTLNFLDRNLKR